MDSFNWDFVVNIRLISRSSILRSSRNFYPDCWFDIHPGLLSYCFAATNLFLMASAISTVPLGGRREITGCFLLDLHVPGNTSPGDLRDGYSRTNPMGC
jgi:hypothetical protein